MPPSTFTPFSGRRVALVTGAGSGIGRAIALRLASDGYSVGLNDIPGNKEVLDVLSTEIIGGEKDSVHPDWEAQKVAVLCADVTDEDAVREMVEGCVRELGRLDVVSSFCSSMASLTLHIGSLVLSAHDMILFSDGRECRDWCRS